jgi:hypothetical protein
MCLVTPNQSDARVNTLVASKLALYKTARLSCIASVKSGMAVTGAGGAYYPICLHIPSSILTVW